MRERTPHDGKPENFEMLAGRRSFPPEQIAWVNQARTQTERNRRLAELKSRYAGEITIDGLAAGAGAH
jgi:hypothetical protein